MAHLVVFASHTETLGLLPSVTAVQAVTGVKAESSEGQV